MMTIWLLFDLNSVTFLLWTSQLGLILYAIARSLMEIVFVYYWLKNFIEGYSLYPTHLADDPPRMQI